MNFSALNRFVSSRLDQIDHYQRRHKWLAFLFAVIKKYGEDEAGNKAALIAYYGFLSLFPLLLVLATVVTLVAQQNHQLGDHIISGAVTYFPVVGRDIQQRIHGLHRSGIALITGVILTLFGARGIADAFRNSLDHIWHVPYIRRATFPLNIMKSMVLIVAGGFGAALAPLVSSAVLAFSHGVLFRFIALSFSTVILFWTLVFMVKVGSSVPHRFSEIATGILVATISIQMLVTVGSVIMAKELARLDTLYGTFAVVLGLVFWIYLQAQVLLYALEIDTVRTKHLWPRSMRGGLTHADKRAYRLYAGRTMYHAPEESGE